MESIIIKESFFNSSIVQGLKVVCPRDCIFTKSSKVLADIVFPYCGNISFSVLYPDHLNDDGIARLTRISETFANTVIIICISPEEAELYSNFLCTVPVNISAVVCFPHENFQKVVPDYIYQAATEFRQRTREIEKLLQRKRKDNLDPDIQAKEIFRNLIKKEDVREDIENTFKTETGTIRKTISERIPELLECDFYLEPDDDE